MTTALLMKKIKNEDYLLPKDIFADTTREELICQLEEIYSKHRDVLDSQSDFRRKYTDIVNYVYGTFLSKKTGKFKTVFKADLITYLLNTPENS